MHLTQTRQEILAVLVEEVVMVWVVEPELLDKEMMVVLVEDHRSEAAAVAALEKLDFPLEALVLEQVEMEARLLSLVYQHIMLVVEVHLVTVNLHWVALEEEGKVLEMTELLTLVVAAALVQRIILLAALVAQVSSSLPTQLHKLCYNT